MPDLALFQPDIPQNTGTMLRMAACLGRTVHLIEPAGFPLSSSAMKRAGMDYLERAALTSHLNWETFTSWRMTEERRLILLTTKSEMPYTSFAFAPSDILLLGRESSGVPETVHHNADARLTVPMVKGMRSLNVAISAGIVLGEALRQTNEFPANP